MKKHENYIYLKNSIRMLKFYLMYEGLIQSHLQDAQKHVCLRFCNKMKLKNIYLNILLLILNKYERKELNNCF